MHERVCNQAPVDVRRVRGWHQTPDWDECRVDNLRYGERTRESERARESESERVHRRESESAREGVQAVSVDGTRPQMGTSAAWIT